MFKVQGLDTCHCTADDFCCRSQLHFTHPDQCFGTVDWAQEGHLAYKKLALAVSSGFPNLE